MRWYLAAVFCIPCVAFRYAAADEGTAALVHDCARAPEFVASLGISSPVFSTSDRFRVGLLLIDGVNSRVYQHPSWRTAGRLGPIATDGEGFVYVAPVPNVNTLENPFEKQNAIYRVDTKTQVMAEFVSLPSKNLPSMANPYGLLGLSYDCTRRVLFAASVAGSSAEKEEGRLFAIDVSSAKVISEFSGVDAIGVEVWSRKGGDALLFGRARSGRVDQVAIDRKGRFVGAPTPAFTFDPFHSLRARKLRFERPNVLSIEATEFNYNLIGATEIRSHRYRFEYILDDNSWREITEPEKKLRVPGA